MIFSISRAERPLAYRPPTTAPMLVPAIASSGTWSSSSTLRTPMCAAPRAPPPESTKPMRGRLAASAVASLWASACVMPWAVSHWAARRRLSTQRRGAPARVACTGGKNSSLRSRARLPVGQQRASSRIMRSMTRSCSFARSADARPGTLPARARALGALVAALCATSGTALAQAPAASDWGYYGGDAFAQHFSSLDQINRGNVAQLSVAWVYRTGELGAGLASGNRLTFEATPVQAFGLLYLETATNVLIALDPVSGRPRWRFDPHVD